ncbi:MAG: aldo/keto reductase [Erysipelotrichaceae bacterium]|nr:aldo/keto reductase [Erysipelotrichaceae bacterium]
MEKRKIGNLMVSPVGMGCMAFSHGYGQIPGEEQSIEAIRKAYEFGCTFFDTAEVYGSQLYYTGHNEQIVGKAVEPFRKDVVLATKLFITPEEYQSGLEEAIRRHLIKSLENLRTDYLDLYYLHRVNKEVPVEEVAKVMGKLVNEGLIAEWGLSQVAKETLEIAHRITPVAAVQNLYNMLERDCEQEIFPYCLENNIAVIPFSPVASGLLSGKITSDTEFEKVDDVRNWVPQLAKENLSGNQAIVDALTSFAKKKGATTAQIALAWMLKKYPNVIPIPGSKNQERIIENLGSWNVVLSDEEFKELDAMVDGFEVHGHRGIVQFA